MSMKLLNPLLVGIITLTVVFGCKSSDVKNTQTINDNKDVTNSSSAVNSQVSGDAKYREIGDVRRGAFRIQWILVAPNISDSELGETAKEVHSKHAENEKQTRVYYLNTEDGFQAYKDWATAPEPDAGKSPTEWMDKHIIANSVLMIGGGERKLAVNRGRAGDLITSFDWK